jgi:hypothetical protein
MIELASRNVVHQLEGIAREREELDSVRLDEFVKHGVRREPVSPGGAASLVPAPAPSATTPAPSAAMLCINPRRLIGYPATSRSEPTPRWLARINELQLDRRDAAPTCCIRAACRCPRP